MTNNDIKFNHQSGAQVTVKKDGTIVIKSPGDIHITSTGKLNLGK